MIQRLQQPAQTTQWVDRKLNIGDRERLPSLLFIILISTGSGYQAWKVTPDEDCVKKKGLKGMVFATVVWYINSGESVFQSLLESNVYFEH